MSFRMPCYLLVVSKYKLVPLIRPNFAISSIPIATSLFGSLEVAGVMVLQIS